MQSTNTWTKYDGMMERAAQCEPQGRAPCGAGWQGLFTQRSAAPIKDKHSRYQVELSAVYVREPAILGIRNNNFI